MTYANQPNELDEEPKVDPNAQVTPQPMVTTTSTSLPGQAPGQAASDIAQGQQAAINAAKGTVPAIKESSEMNVKASEDAGTAQQQAISDVHNQMDLARQRTSEALSDIRKASNIDVDPQRYINNMDGGQKVMAGIGLLLSGFGGADAVQKSWGVINQGIQNDISAQIGNRAAKMTGAKDYGDIANTAAQKSLDYFQQMGVANQALYKTHLDAVGAKLQQMLASPIGKDPNSAPMLQQLLSQVYNKSAELDGTIGQQIGTKSTETIMKGSGLSGDPAYKKILMLPANIQGPAIKELGEYQLANDKMKDIDKIYPILRSKAPIVNVLPMGSSLPSVRESSKQFDAIWGPFLDKLTKDASGKVVPTSVELLNSLRPQSNDSNETLMAKMESAKTLARDIAKPAFITKAGIVPELNTKASLGKPAPKSSEASSQSQKPSTTMTLNVYSPRTGNVVPLTFPSADLEQVKKAHPEIAKLNGGK